MFENSQYLSVIRSIQLVGHLGFLIFMLAFDLVQIARMEGV